MTPDFGNIPRPGPITVMGAGGWGTAFAMILADAGNRVRLWARRPEIADGIRRTGRNPDYLRDVALPPTVQAMSDPVEALAGAHAVVLAVPSQQLRANLERWDIPSDALVVSLAKGVEVGTLLTMSRVIEGTGVERRRILAVSGPNLADEIAAKQPATTVVAGHDAAAAEEFGLRCRAPYFRPYTSTDVIGIEIAGATKNAIALAVGMGLGRGFGANSMASLITRGLAETSRLGESLGADPHTFAGLAGMGDLVATCMSPLSRNRTFGEHLGRGLSVEEAAQASRGIAEGVRSSSSILQLAERQGVEMPIVERVVRVLAGEIEPEESIRSLMARETKPER
ncbi:MAG TPA: NAD(P)-dependent glycerol-3-phosphate dehydrogenase [Propionibacterium sp.]|jgi:glycerol-3-phosphate dehydrogenase (NAD(P)+)|nr:NAD(P)-dependent glycerol-3-phosphate dehydrogenase [Propionibacterium sp.]